MHTAITTQNDIQIPSSTSGEVEQEYAVIYSWIIEYGMYKKTGNWIRGPPNDNI